MNNADETQLQNLLRDLVFSQVSVHVCEKKAKKWRRKAEEAHEKRNAAWTLVTEFVEAKIPAARTYFEDSQ